MVFIHVFFYEKPVYKKLEAGAPKTLEPFSTEFLGLRKIKLILKENYLSIRYYTYNCIF